MNLLKINNMKEKHGIVGLILLTGIGIGLNYVHGFEITVIFFLSGILIELINLNKYGIKK